MQELEAGILRTEYLGDSKYLIALDCENISREASPGQFLQVRTSYGTSPFLRRTFSISGTYPEKNEVRILFQVVGDGTEILCRFKRGGSLNIIGPLGTGFKTLVSDSGASLLVGGGIGIAPLLFLSKKLTSLGKKHSFMFGARNLPGIESIKAFLPEETMYATDNGTYGYHGYLHNMLEVNIDKLSPSVIYTCGPDQMMKAVAVIAQKNNIPCQVSLEERMACGIGACFGCAIPHKDGRMVRTCVEGPIFDSREVFFE